MADTDPIAVANRWIKAYNEKDYDTLKSVIHDDITMQHHQRTPVLHGPDAVLKICQDFDGLTSVKRFHPPTRQFATGDVVVTEHTWEAKATVDIPGFVAEGETLKLELCGVWKVKDGQVVQYDDYG